MVLSAVGTAGCHSVLGPAAPDAHWTVRDSVHVSFYVRPGSFAEQHVAVFGDLLDDQYAATLARLEATYAGRLTAFLYDSAADTGLPSDRSGVAYPSTGALGVVCVPPLDANLMALLAHEANHVLVRSALGRPGTTFMNEGLASALISERHHALGRTFLYAWTRSHRAELPPLTDLIDDGKWRNYPESAAYNASASFLSYLLETYGAGPMKEIYHLSSSEVHGRFLEVYGRSLATASEEWLEFCERRAPQGDPESTR